MQFTQNIFLVSDQKMGNDHLRTASTESLVTFHPQQSQMNKNNSETIAF